MPSTLPLLMLTIEIWLSFNVPTPIELALSWPLVDIWLCSGELLMLINVDLGAVPGVVPDVVPGVVLGGVPGAVLDAVLDAVHGAGLDVAALGMALGILIGYHMEMEDIVEAVVVPEDL
jgi:hypothetical protein